jgi:hypothetical protein
VAVPRPPATNLGGVEGPPSPMVPRQDSTCTRFHLMPSSGVQTPLCFLFNAGGGTRISVHGDEMAHDATIRKDEEAEGCGSFCS